MDKGGKNSPANDQRQKELSISIAASSMINASDVIGSEAYQANLKRIQEVKEMVQRLEMNNEAAHKNYLIDQLEKRAKDGREAEDLLARLRDRPGTIPQTAQFATGVPSDKPEVILPTTATLVEVPESHPSLSHSSPASTATSHPQTVPQSRLAMFESLPTQIQPYYSNTFRYYVPSKADREAAQNGTVLLSRPPVDTGQMNRHATQDMLQQPGMHGSLTHQTSVQSRQVQQASQLWNNYPPQVNTSLPAVPTSAHVPPVRWVGAVPTQTRRSTGPSYPTYREPGFPIPSTGSLAPVTIHNRSQNLPSPVLISPLELPLQAVPATTSAHPPSIRSRPKTVESQSQLVSTAVPKPMTTSEPSRSHKLLYQLPQQLQKLQQLPQHPLPPQLHSQPLRTLHEQQLQQPSQPPPQLQQRPQQSQVQPSFQPPQAHFPSQSTDPTHPTGTPRPSQSTKVPEQAQWRGLQPRMDQAAFIKLFQEAAQRETLQFKAFWFQAKAAGISDEWFIAAINSLPRNLWQSIMARANQSGPTVDAPPPPNGPQHQAPVPAPSAPVVVPPALIVIPPVHTTPVAQQITDPTASTEGRAAYLPPGQTSQYATQLQYYAGEATRSALSAQVTSISTIPLEENIGPIKTMLATPTRDVPQARIDMRTPKDANKATLARDILRSLGKTIPKPDQGRGGKPTDQVNDREGGQPLEVTVAQPLSHAALPKPMGTPPPATQVETNSTSRPSASLDVQDEPRHVTHAGPPTVLKDDHGHLAALVDGPIVIDLTIEDSDKSAEGREPILPTFAGATTHLQTTPATTNTTNHTPLLESLSLEEPPVDVAADGHNADVRMHSPPLLFAAEESMEPESSYPLPAGAEPIPPIFEPPPREASEHPLDGKLPLFLPSPPISPAHSSPPEVALEMTIDKSESRTSLKRVSVDVEIESSAEPVAPRIRKRRKQQVYVLIPPAPLYVKRAKLKGRATREGMDSDLEVWDDKEFRYTHFEQMLIEESRSRLLERRCRWSNCGAILNCAANLLAHLKNHAREEELQALFRCRWTGCQREFGVEQERDVHLERHTIRPLPCPFAGCDEQFDRPVEVMQHEVQHRETVHSGPLTHKPTCQPAMPAIPARLGPPPHWLPSHRVIPRRVVKCRISADRHAVMGPWILWNIWSPVDLNMRKQNAVMRGRPMRQAVDYALDNSDPRRDDYDFLLALSSYPAKNPKLDDLDSSLITMSASRGLTLWGSGPATPEGHTNAVSVTLAVDASLPSSATDETRVEVTAATRKDSLAEERAFGESVGMGEEDAVEGMLIL